VAYTAGLFRELALPRLISLLARRPERRQLLLRLALAFGGGGLAAAAAPQRQERPISRRKPESTRGRSVVALPRAVGNARLRERYDLQQRHTAAKARGVF